MRIDSKVLIEQLDSIRCRAGELEARFAADLADVHPKYLLSAKNLLHYIALRQFDNRELQDQLAVLGLSSLGRAEQHVMASIQAVQKALRSTSGIEAHELDIDQQTFQSSRLSADTHARDLLGAHRKGRSVQIMVTLPSQAADDYALIRSLIDTGMDIARINCAHDISDAWKKMVEKIRRANDETGSACRIVMDLAGPKHRTGHLMPGPRVLRVRPRRDAEGRVISAKRVRFIASDVVWSGRKAGVIPVAAQCIEDAEVGDEIRLKDTRGKKRKLRVVAKDSKGLILELKKQAYIAAGMTLRLVSRQSGETSEFAVGPLPPVEQPIVLRVGDKLILERDNRPGEPARVASDGILLQPAHVSCIPAEILAQVSVSDPVMLNDGKVEGRVESAVNDKLVVRITKAKRAGSRLRSNRGINFPKSDPKGRGLTELDKEQLGFVVRNADAVGLSFVREPADVIALQEELRKYPNCELGIVPKIETEQAFSELPRILLATMRTYPAGIMIARGDLAVECGWVRLAEIQEEIMWLCEAARIPVVWATQVLEDEAKKGRPTRAEITDAAMSQRADCVMLNKGPHILAAVRMLDDILRRMQQHQYKKFSRLPRLNVSDI